MPSDNVEGKVVAHALSAVCQQHTETFVGWALTVPSCGNPARMLAMEVMVWVGAVWRY